MNLRYEPTGSEQDNQAYYDDFSTRYDAQRGGRTPGGYHDLVDDLEVDFASRYVRSADVLEVGCGTGLILERLASIARTARGLDLSPGMLDRARSRGLDVTLGSATALPFSDHSFDVVCSFKVLAHVRDIDVALREMARVTRPGGTVLAEFYNPWSVRALVKRFGPAGKISEVGKEDRVFTRYDSEQDVRRLLPVDLTMESRRGIRVITPVAKALQVPWLGSLLRDTERRVCDGPLAALGGFVVYALRKDT